MSRNYVYGNMTSTISWSPIAAYYDELPYAFDGLMHAAQPWSGHYDVDQAIWVTAHHTHFAQPGWHYLPHGHGVSELVGGGSLVSLTDGQQLTLILEAVSHNLTACINDGSAPGTAITQTVHLRLRGQWGQLQSLHAFRSDLRAGSEALMQYEGEVKVVGGVVSFLLQADTLWTLSTLNTTKGSHPPSPPPSPFPSSYSDTFDSTPLQSEAAYFTDQSGSFEVVQSTYRQGRVMRQAVVVPPVSWCGEEAPYPYSVVGRYVGGSGAGVSVNVSVDVLVEGNGTAMVGVGVGRGGCVGAAGSPGIVLALTVGRGWVVSNSTTLRGRVAEGKVEVKAEVWYRLGLEVGSKGTVATVDGARVAEVALTTGQFLGWVAIASSFDHVQFDQFAVSVAEEKEEAVMKVDSRHESRRVDVSVD